MFQLILKLNKVLSVFRQNISPDTTNANEVNSSSLNIIREVYLVQLIKNALNVQRFWFIDVIQEFDTRSIFNKLHASCFISELYDSVDYRNDGIAFFGSINQKIRRKNVTNIINNFFEAGSQMEIVN